MNVSKCNVTGNWLDEDLNELIAMVIACCKTIKAMDGSKYDFGLKQQVKKAILKTVNEAMDAASQRGHRLASEGLNEE